MRPAARRKIPAITAAAAVTAAVVAALLLSGAFRARQSRPAKPPADASRLVEHPAQRSFVWPTPLPVNATTSELQIAQAAASGDPATGLFGTARNNGWKFHEGLDIKPAARDRRGEPVDRVVAAIGGKIVHVVPRPNGPYGRHLVLRHVEAGLTYYTLYAHLRSVTPALTVGTRVAAGAELGVMGRSDDGRGFPKERAHLHFEVGLRLNPAFPSWYARNPNYNKQRNRQGEWNGLNLYGFDPLPFLREGLRTNEVPSALERVRAEPIAVTVDYAGGGIPTFVRENPALLTAPLPADGRAPAGWRIGLAWHGLPVRWTPLSAAELGPVAGRGAVRVEISPNAELQRLARARRLVSRNKRGALVTDEVLARTLDILFTN
ncbi:MAG: M23 family metallopeptidase [Puniceicoccales bacterium]|jgi:murein DD-endopeptidase MepM/ murein hydrolase activator NlpD|nr:M23 family metallopeptidase [Puniceicoccales bacterium]